MFKLHSSYLFCIILLSISVSSCATIIGGSRYNAKVLVQNHPNAKILYKGSFQGTGEANFKAHRKEANDFSVTIKQEGCKTETKHFTQRSFRGWAFAGTVFGWTGIYMGVPLPWGVGLDGILGSWWKPDISEKGVTKQDYNNYIYNIHYTGCDNQPPSLNNTDSKADSNFKQ